MLVGKSGRGDFVKVYTVKRDPTQLDDIFGDQNNAICARMCAPTTLCQSAYQFYTLGHLLRKLGDGPF
jgi:hypothetical protein